MPRQGRSKTLATGIYEDGTGYRIVVAGKERRFRPPMSLAKLLRKRAEFLDELTAANPASTAARGALRRELLRYAPLVQHLADPGSHLAHVRAWLEPLGDELRSHITRDQILEVRGEWVKRGVKPKTINNRVSALRALYHTLDGEDARTPCDRIKPLPSHRTPAVSVSAALILAVDQKLQQYERDGYLRDTKTRARFRVRASTGRRPSEIMRAQPEDVDLTRRIWTPRDGKGGFTPGIYLTADMVDAWKLFIEADAWGPFSTDSMAEVLRHCGWPDAIRPYNLRHSVGIALSEGGVDLADVQQMMGHKHQSTTRTHYVPVLQTRLQKASEVLAGRLPWDRPVPRNGAKPNMAPRRNTQQKVESGTRKKARTNKRKSR